MKGIWTTLTHPERLDEELARGCNESGSIQDSPSWFYMWKIDLVFHYIANGLTWSVNTSWTAIKAATTLRGENEKSDCHHPSTQLFTEALWRVSWPVPPLWEMRDSRVPGPVVSSLGSRENRWSFSHFNPWKCLRSAVCADSLYFTFTG